MKFFVLFFLTAFSVLAQTAEKAGVTAELSDEGNKLTIEAHGVKPVAPLLYTAEVDARSMFLHRVVRERATVTFRRLQGEAKRLSLRLASNQARVIRVTGEGLASWSVRQVGKERFLDVVPVDLKIDELTVSILLQRRHFKLPASFAVSTYGPAEAAKLTARYELASSPGLDLRLVEATQASRLEDEDENSVALSATGWCELSVETFLRGATPRPVELSQASLSGRLDPDGSSITFTYRAQATVTSDKAVTFSVLSGHAAPVASEGQSHPFTLNYQSGEPVYGLTFEEAGNFPVVFSFVAPVTLAGEQDWRALDFKVPGGAVIPFRLSGLSEDSAFDPKRSVVPTFDVGQWKGFLPANGRGDLAWQPRRSSGEGEDRLFFNSEARSDVAVGAGLLRQTTTLNLRTLQGRLAVLTVDLAGQGEVVAVEGKNLLGWQVEGAVLEIRLSRPVTESDVLTIRSQLPLDVLPVKAEPLRLTPRGAVRHSGHLRIFNRGAVRLEVGDSVGLTQFAPDQYPGDSLDAQADQVRQSFYYRFPSANRSYTVSVARVKPELSLSQILVYELTETDRVLRADLELDIREAGIRDWEFLLPADYAVVSATGVEVADYLLSEAQGGRRRLKILFAKEVQGRRLIRLHLEHNQRAQAGLWSLPVMTFPDVRFTRGELGLLASPGFRLVPGAVDGLVDIPLAHFQKNQPRLQHAYRLRRAEWAASLTIEVLGKNVQADLFHHYSLKDRTAYVSVLANYFVTGSPVGEWQFQLPEGAENVHVEGLDVRDSRQADGVLSVPLHRPVMGPYQLLVTWQEKAQKKLSLGTLKPLQVQGERGYLQVVSTGQVELGAYSGTDENLIELDALELPGEYQLLSQAPSLAVWQYTARPFALTPELVWFEQSEAARQVVEFAEAETRLSRDGGSVTHLVYDVRTRGERIFRVEIPEDFQVNEVQVNGETVTSRQNGTQRLIPLPGQAGPGKPVQISMRASKTGQGAGNVQLLLPRVMGATQLMARWDVISDVGINLAPRSHDGLERINVPSQKNGFDWIREQAVLSLAALGLVFCFGCRMVWHAERWGSLTGYLVLMIAVVGAIFLAFMGWNQDVYQPLDRLEFVVPVVGGSALPAVELTLVDDDQWRLPEPVWKLGLVALGALVLGTIFPMVRRTGLILGGLAFAIALLFLNKGATYFFASFSLVGAVLLVKGLIDRGHEWRGLLRRGSSVATLFLLMAVLSSQARADEVEKKIFRPKWPVTAELHEKWQLSDDRVLGEATLTFSGKAGEEFLLLHGPGVLTSFEGMGVKVRGENSNYLAVPEADGEYDVHFTFEAPVETLEEGVPMLTSISAIRSLEVHYPAAGWGISSRAAVRAERVDSVQGSAARLWLGPSPSVRVFLAPQSRRVADEDTRFFVEADQVFLPGPGVVNAKHYLTIRPSQGEVRDLSVIIPMGFTVAEVFSSVVSAWRFDPETRQLSLEVSPGQSQAFSVNVLSQRALTALPASTTVAPARVAEASGEIGMLALAFGADAQLNQATPTGLSLVNAADFNARLLPGGSALQKVWRYTQEEASLDLTVAPVAPEVRVETQEKLSFGDERIVHAVEFITSITRAGVFQLRFPVPQGFEVESLTGAALHHWVEAGEDDQRQVLMNLNGKTLGEHRFNLVLAANTPSLPLQNKEWPVPKFSLTEASRSVGQLVIVPGRGIQLRPISRRDVSAIDPRQAGGHQSGALAYRLLQNSWQLGLGVDQLEPSLSVRSLQTVELRESHTRTRVTAQLQVDQASIRSLLLQLPPLSESDADTVRASGAEVSDLVLQDDGRWELRFKRRVVGEVEFRIDFHQGQSIADVSPVTVPGARQHDAWLALRPGAQLELKAVPGSGWNTADWNALPRSLRPVSDVGSPATSLRAVNPQSSVQIELTRHAVAASSRIRVTKAELHTIVSPDWMTVNEARLQLTVIQRGAIELSLPPQSQLIGVFVNDVSALVVRKGEKSVFQVSERDQEGGVAMVTALYTASFEPGQLEAFSLGEPLENIDWLVSVPQHFELKEHAGDLDLLKDDLTRAPEERATYRQRVAMRRESAEQKARQSLDRVSDLLQRGNNQSAYAMLEQVANGNLLSVAGNEDARVQFENLATQQVTLGFNTRLQRTYLDNKAVAEENLQLDEAVLNNPVIRGDLNYRPDDFSKVLKANRVEDNRAANDLAARWIAHQRVTDPVPQLIDAVLSHPGRSYHFSRGIQVDGHQSLALTLDFKTEEEADRRDWLVVGLIALMLVGLNFGLRGAGVPKD